MNVPLIMVVVLTRAPTGLAPSSAVVPLASNLTRMVSHAAVSHVYAIIGKRELANLDLSKLGKSSVTIVTDVYLVLPYDQLQTLMSAT